MFFDQLVESLKLLLLKRKCSRMLHQDLIRPIGENRLTTFGIIIDLDKYDADTLVQNLLSSFGLKQQQVNVLGYSKNPRTSQNAYYKINENLSWFDGVVHPYVIAFCELQYTYLINFHAHNEPSVFFMSLKTSALIRIGFQDDNTADVIINQLPENTPSLFKALHNYIQKLTIDND